jgi:hypothetical protein
VYKLTNLSSLPSIGGNADIYEIQADKHTPEITGRSRHPHVPAQKSVESPHHDQGASHHGKENLSADYTNSI